LLANEAGGKEIWEVRLEVDSQLEQFRESNLWHLSDDVPVGVSTVT